MPWEKVRPRRRREMLSRHAAAIWRCLVEGSSHAPGEEGALDWHGGRHYSAGSRELLRGFLFSDLSDLPKDDQ